VSVDWDRLLRDAFLVASAVWVLAILVGASSGQGDARIFWSTTLANPYDFREYVSDGPGFFYSPAFAQLTAPLTTLPWPVFAALWSAFELVALWAVAGPWSVLTLVFLPVLVELWSGNVNLPIAAVTALGVRYPGLWAFGILTKVTPGIGVVWFAARGEWRHLATAVGVTGLVVLASWTIAPQLWVSWVETLVSAREAVGWVALPPLYARLAVAAALVWWAGRRGHTWPLPVAVTLSFAAIWPASLSVLVALLAAAPPPSVVFARLHERLQSALPGHRLESVDR
jgi:hypothetical protein